MIITSYTKLNNAPNNKINIEDTLKLKILIRIIVIKEKAKIIALKDFKSMLLAILIPASTIKKPTPILIPVKA